MIKYLPICLLVFGCLLSCEKADVDSDARPVSHALWDELLRTHVDSLGMVDYRGLIADSVRLNRYLGLLRTHHPNTAHWSREEQLAYWINAYNAFTVKLILDHYPVASIKQIKPGIPFINSVFDLAFIRIEEQLYSLNDLEHGIIRPKFKEPLIHFAVNCASFSCPALHNEAYVPERLPEQLAAAAHRFLNDPRKNRLSAERLELSRILQWYWMDFRGHYESRASLVATYTDLEIAPDAKVDFLPYDWSLNER